MKGELLDFIDQYGLSPFSSTKTSIRRSSSAVFKTSDSRSVFTRTLNFLSSSFVFSETANLWHCFDALCSKDEVLNRQDFFRSLSSVCNNSFLSALKAPRRSWSPEYDVLVVTEDETLFASLQQLSCPVKLLVSEHDLGDLDRYDVVQVIDCESFSRVLERLPQSVFVSDENSVYLERYLEELSGWREHFEILRASQNPDILALLERLRPLFSLLGSASRERLTVERAEQILEELNETLNAELRVMTVSGDSLVKMLSEGVLPEGFGSLIDDLIDQSALPRDVFEVALPLKLDYAVLDRVIAQQSAEEFSSVAVEITRHSELLLQIPTLLRRLESLLLFEDFCLGLSIYISSCSAYSVIDSRFELISGVNVFVDDAQPISFSLGGEFRCSILTGANSGGKTTLLEHVLQLFVFSFLGLPVRAEGLRIPLFSHVYYFAKNKGATGTGAFETLLSQMSGIRPGSATLVLADEIEAVTEPGVAGTIIAATAEYFVSRGCLLIVATHLGHEIAPVLPIKTRVDGIEAKGLDSDFNLIVDHNPVMGRLAHSTPELIVEKMASTRDEEYFMFLKDKLRSG